MATYKNWALDAAKEIASQVCSGDVETMRAVIIKHAPLPVRRHHHRAGLRLRAVGDEMTFAEALKKLNIEDYGERIFNSNSHGELFHVYDYIVIAESLTDASWFREWFIALVEMAKTWKRPESVFQHVLRALQETLEAK